MKYLLLASCLLITACDSEADKAAKKGAIAPTPGAWAVTEDITLHQPFTTKILVDPQGQKFLVVIGTGIIPYKELPTTIEKN